jgi:biopolymer transport protein ExbD
MASVGGSEGGEPEFQIAPMIDVLLVLLIFFMSITTAEILKVDPSITLPVSANAKRAEAELSKHEVAINVRWDPKTSKAAIVVEDNEYTNPEELPPYLQKRHRIDPLLRAVVRCDKDSPAIEVQRVMSLIAEGGIADISFAAASK